MSNKNKILEDIKTDNISEKLVTYETAILAKEKGFNIDCGWKLRKLDDGSFTHTNCSDLGVEQPTQALLQKCLRLKNIDISIIPNWKKGIRFYYVVFSFINENNEIDIYLNKDKNNNKIEYSEYEDALEVALFEALKKLP
jgi:hypothetical protein